MTDLISREAVIELLETTAKGTIILGGQKYRTIQLDEIAAAIRALPSAQVDEVERLTKERERLALAICGGEDAPGYANAQTVETLENVARSNANATLEQINRTLAAEEMAAKVGLDWQRAERRANDNFDRAEAAEAKVAKLEAAVIAAAKIGQIVGFLGSDEDRIGAFREACGPELWAKARAALAEIEGDQK